MLLHANMITAWLAEKRLTVGGIPRHLRAGVFPSLCHAYSNGTLAGDMAILCGAGAFRASLGRTDLAQGGRGSYPMCHIGRGTSPSLRPLRLCAQVSTGLDSI